MRYAALHRTIQKGLASDATYTELAEICLELGLESEALDAQAKVQRTSERLHLQNKLVQKGLLDRPDFSPRAVKTERRGLLSELREALGFLADDQMPVVLVLATVAFPVIMGFGGYASQLYPDVVPISAVLIPAALVLMVLMAVCRRVLVEAAQGIEDAPPMPGLGKLFGESFRLVLETAVAAVMLLGPAVASWFFGLPWYGVAGGLAGGLLLMPITVGLMMSGHGFRAMAPAVVLPAACRGGLRYVGLVAAIALLMTPAAACWLLASDSLPMLRIAFVGPLAVAPLVMSFRLLGRFLFDNRAKPVRRDEPKPKLRRPENGPGSTKRQQARRRTRKPVRPVFTEQRPELRRGSPPPPTARRRVASALGSS